MKYKSWKEVPRKGRFTVVNKIGVHNYTMGKTYEYDMSYAQYYGDAVTNIVPSYPQGNYLIISNVEFEIIEENLDFFNSKYDELEEQFNELGDRISEFKNTEIVYDKTYSSWTKVPKKGTFKVVKNMYSHSYPMNKVMEYNKDEFEHYSNSTIQMPNYNNITIQEVLFPKKITLASLKKEFNKIHEELELTKAKIKELEKI